MNNQTNITASLLVNNNSEDVLSFLQSKNVNAQKNQNLVKSYFEDHDFILAIYDGQENQNTMLLRVKDFTRNEDTLIELNTIFRNATSDMGTTHILKVARQATDDVIGMLPTFQAFFGEKTANVPAVRISSFNFVATQNTNIAA